MKKRTRTVLFIICVFFFLLAAPTVVLYSQGYRFDFEKRKITQTGAFYFKASPKSVEVYFDSEHKKTSTITGSLLIENLLPKTYVIEIKKEGYYSWQKNLPVAEKQVTEIKNIVLVPENPTFTIVSQKPEIMSSATSSDKSKLVESNEHEIWILFLKEQTEQPPRRAGDKIFLTRFSEKIGDVFWLTDYYLIFSVGDKIKVAEIDNRDRINIVDLAEFKSPKLSWDQNNKRLYIQSEGKIYVAADLLF